MPTLSWANKIPPIPIPGSLELDSIIYPQGRGYLSRVPEQLPKNHLVMGDNLAVMSALLLDYEGKIDLIYADPPFYTNRRYAARIGQGEDSRKPEQWQLAEGYLDAWDSIESYLNMLYPRLYLIHRLLSPNGTLYLHLDWHADAYARLLLDEIFGANQLLNEIIWVYHGPSPIRKAFNRKHDTILVYTKGKDYTFNADAVRTPYDETTVKTFASSNKAGFGKVPDLARGKVPEDWWYFPVVARLHSERTGYPTQKPEALLERVILASSNPGDLVADFFCGAGTTTVVAERLERHFIASDVSWRAVHTARARLAGLSTTPFSLQVETQSKVEAIPLQDSALVTLSGDVIHLNPSLLPDLLYWEVDPHWDGKLFHSVAQACRPRQKAQITSQLSIPFAQSGNRISVRLVSINGQLSTLQIRE